MRLGGDWAPGSRDVEINIPFSGIPFLLNIEGPLLESFSKNDQIEKAGPNLANKRIPDTKDQLVCILANNHIMDYGIVGLNETLLRIRQSNSLSLGAGSNIRDAESSQTLQWNDMRIGILARCETQFGTATHASPGVAVLSPTVYEAIRNLKKECDLVVVSIHAAAEMCPWPSCKRQDAWRSLIDAGVDIVHGHHSHIPQGWERYKKGVIFYGLGNFCVDPIKWAKIPNTLWSLVPEISIAGGQIEVALTTTVIEDTGDRVRVRQADQLESENHGKYLDACNLPLADRLLLEGLWHEAAVKMYDSFYSQWLNAGVDKNASLRRYSKLILQSLKRSLNVMPSTNGNLALDRQRNLLWHVLFACDSHNDAISTALGILSGAINDLRTEETARLVSEMMT